VADTGVWEESNREYQQGLHLLNTVYYLMVILFGYHTKVIRLRLHFLGQVAVFVDQTMFSVIQSP